MTGVQTCALPIWYQEFDGGRQWYTALGHKIEYYQDKNFIKHIEGGIRWAMSKTPAETPK